MPNCIYMVHLLCTLFLTFLITGLKAEVSPNVTVGLDNLFTPPYEKIFKGKRIGLITNHTAINRAFQSSVEVFKLNESHYDFKLTALFAPEHGLTGAVHAEKNVKNEIDSDGIPIYSLYGNTRRPTPDMLKSVDLLVFDVQDIGARSYTYISTLFYAMEEATKMGIPVIVADRPNPINGTTIDGPMLEPEFRSFVGYINVPYCHGMTVGELALYFNEEYKIGCNLHVIPMNGWKRSMTFKDTGLTWMPTSPHIPEADTPLYYPVTGQIGELQFINIGIGYTLPFKIIGAPWIDPIQFAEQLNKQKFPGVRFIPFHFCPFFGRFAKKICQGVLIVITDPKIFLPVSTQYLILGTLKNLYPNQLESALTTAQDRKEMFNKISGSAEIYNILKNEKNIIWKLRGFNQKERQEFVNKRKKYLLYE